MALLILAGLQIIPADVYEAARVDGATTWQRFRQITLPLVRPALMVAVLFRTLDVLRIYDLPAILTGGGGNGTHHAVDPGGRPDPAGLQQCGGAVHDHLPVHLLRGVPVRQVPRRERRRRPRRAGEGEVSHGHRDLGRPRAGATSPRRRCAGQQPASSRPGSGPTSAWPSSSSGAWRRSTGWSSRRSATSATPSTPRPWPTPRHARQLPDRVLHRAWATTSARRWSTALIIGVTTTVIGLVVGVFAAYALARLKFRGKFLVLGLHPRRLDVPAASRC